MKFLGVTENKTLNMEAGLLEMVPGKVYLMVLCHTPTGRMSVDQYIPGPQPGQLTDNDISEAFRDHFIHFGTRLGLIQPAGSMSLN